MVAQEEVEALQRLGDIALADGVDHRQPFAGMRMIERELARVRQGRQCGPGHRQECSGEDQAGGVTEKKSAREFCGFSMGDPDRV
jgi:hypothetical protein